MALLANHGGDWAGRVPRLLFVNVQQSIGLEKALRLFVTP